MAKKPLRDRYDVSGNVEAEYVDAEQTVLVNKLGISDLHTLQVLEERALAKAYETLLTEVRVDTRLTAELILHIHRRIFGELFDWAGRWRTVNISKPGITWPPPAYLDENIRQFERDVLQPLDASALGDEATLCSAVAKIQSEFLVIHPFREGNARTIKVVTDLLAVQTGRAMLVYDQTDEGRDRYIFAASQAFKRNYGPMEEIIRQAAQAGRRPPGGLP